MLWEHIRQETKIVGKIRRHLEKWLYTSNKSPPQAGSGVEPRGASMVRDPEKSG